MTAPDGSPLDPVRLMWAVMQNECLPPHADGSYDFPPRHEPAWDVGGRYGKDPRQAQLLAKYGSAAACSYGPWQVMYYNCVGFVPAELTDPEKGAQAFLAFATRQIKRQKPQDLVEFGEIWNAGHVTPDPAYTSRLITHYGIPLPDPTTT